MLSFITKLHEKFTLEQRKDITVFSQSENSTLCSALTTLSHFETRVVYTIVWLKLSIQS